MIDKMYYDILKDKYVLEKDTIAPPERYVLVFRGENNGIVIEEWTAELKDGGTTGHIGFSYMKDDEDDLVAKARNAHFEYHHCRPKRLKYWTIPPERFDRYVKMFHLEEKKEKDNAV